MLEISDDNNIRYHQHHHHHHQRHDREQQQQQQLSVIVIHPSTWPVFCRQPGAGVCAAASQPPPLVPTLCTDADRTPAQHTHTCTGAQTHAINHAINR